MGKDKKKKNKKFKAEQIKQPTIKGRDEMQDNKLQDILNEKMQAGSYDEALDTVVELLEKNCREPQVFYQAAQAYFMLGDYDRAAQWVTNTLQYAPEHVGARLLLARICLLEDRESDAMQIFTQLLSVYGSSLSESDKEDICEAVDYTYRTDKDWLQDNYPKVAELMANHKDGIVSAEADGSAEQMQSAAPAENEDIVGKIKAKDISLRDKVKLFNAFAGGLYVNNDYQGAKSLLQEALKIDAGSELTLKNMAVVEADCGNVDEALRCASMIPDMDFTLLKLINKKHI